jgi:hypothetical protein
MLLEHQHLRRPVTDNAASHAASRDAASFFERLNKSRYDDIEDIVRYPAGDCCVWATGGAGGSIRVRDLRSWR